MDQGLGTARARLLFEEEEMRYDPGETHPMQVRRMQALLDLLETSDLWHADHEQTRLRGGSTTRDQLQLIHTPDYITAVERLSQPLTRPEEHDEQQARDQLAQQYGLGVGDTPAFVGMHAGASAIVGGTLIALSAVMGLPEGGEFAQEGERPLHVFHPAGGWHHAQAARASGFCIYDDIAVAIAHLIRAREARVVYIDFDAHHGDGVQQAFYDDPRVLTISLHETGRTLFPGTGDVMEIGAGSGRGYAINIPLEPYTDDMSYLDVMDMTLAPLLEGFGPDVLISMHGCDTHAWDPLSHLTLSMRGIQAQARIAHQLAHRYCAGRWVAVGGGGYEPYRVVPRAWSLLWAEMAHLPRPVELPPAWIARWKPIWQEYEDLQHAQQLAIGQEESPKTFPTAFMDFPTDIIKRSGHERTWSVNRETASRVRQLFVSSGVRQAFPTPRPPSPFAGLFDLLHPGGQEPPSRTRTLQTGHGPVHLRDFCPPSLVERLRADEGLHAFARRSEREQQLLLSIAQEPDCALTLAHTPTGEIVGQVTIAPLDRWWEELENAYEVAIEVSTDWRGQGLARELLAFALDLDALEDMLLFAIGLSWHWDLEGLDMSPQRYRRLITRLFASQGFREYETNEPDIALSPGNILLVRLGNRVDEQRKAQFLRCLRRAQGPRIFG